MLFAGEYLDLLHGPASAYFEEEAADP